MIDDELTPALAAHELRILTECRCDPAWTDRNMHAPSCVADYRPEVNVLAHAAGVDR